MVPSIHIALMIGYYGVPAYIPGCLDIYHMLFRRETGNQYSYLMVTHTYVLPNYIIHCLVIQILLGKDTIKMVI